MLAAGANRSFHQSIMGVLHGVHVMAEHLHPQSCCKAAKILPLPLSLNVLPGSVVSSRTTLTTLDPNSTSKRHHPSTIPHGGFHGEHRPSSYLCFGRIHSMEFHGVRSFLASTAMAQLWVSAARLFSKEKAASDLRSRSKRDSILALL